jgi:hypothetical protein
MDIQVIFCNNMRVMFITIMMTHSYAIDAVNEIFDRKIVIHSLILLNMLFST